MTGRIYLSSPDVGVEEEQAVVRAVRSGWVAPLGPEVDAFEAEFASFVGVSHAVALNSGTAALHLGLIAMGVTRGDLVITSTMTFVATANAIAYIGAMPVFVDVLPNGCINVDLVEEALVDARRTGKRVGAIVPVDVYGHLADYTSLLPLAESYGVPVLADAAEALGASHAGRQAGTWGDGAAFSFNGNKIMTTSGGGMFATAHKGKAEYVRYLAGQAREPVIHFEHRELGYNYRMSNVCAALGRTQLSRLPEMIAKRRAVRAHYERFFSNFPGVGLLTGVGKEDNCWLTSILIDSSVSGWSAMQLQQHLAQFEIEARPLWKPMHLQPLYHSSKVYGGEVAEDLANRGLALPSGSALTDGDVSRVLGAIADLLSAR